jgi:pimeloyl-ACP methyl ester carboxylesterase
MKSKISTGVLAGDIPFAECGGGGQPLIIINGGQGFVRRADPVRAERDARRVSRILPRGTAFVLLGYPPRPVREGAVGNLVDDLASAIRERWNGPIILLGISYGGILAAWLTIRHPDLVRRLVFIASARRFSSEGEQRVRRQIAFAKSRNFSGFLADFAAVFRRPWLNALVWLRIHLGRTGLAEGMNDADTIVSYLSAILEAGTPPTEEIRAPTLVIGGSRDQFFGEGRMEETARSIGNARLELLKGETHMAPVERAKDVAIAIGNFLTVDQVPATPSGFPE